METNNQNLQSPTPSQPLQKSVKWYKHKGLIAIGILVIIAAGAIWLYVSRLPKLADNSCEKARILKMIDEKGYLLATNGACPSGYQMNAFLCGPNLPAWCEPDKNSTSGNNEVAQPQSTTTNQSAVFFGKASQNKYILVDLQSGETKDFIPSGYTLLDQHDYQMFPTFLILQKDNQLYSYSTEDKITNAIFTYDDLKLKKAEEARIFSSITEKDKFIIRIDTLDLSEVSEFDGSSPILTTRFYSFDASTNKLARIYPADFGGYHSECAEYDSKNQRIFSWPCGEGIGSAGPISISDLDGKNKKEIVNAKDVGATYDDYVKVEYRNGLFFALGNDSGLKIAVIDPQQTNPVKKIYTATEQAKSQIKDISTYSISVDGSTNTLIVGADSYILLLKFDNNQQIVQSKYLPDKEIYANFIFPSDGWLYYQAKDSIRVVNLNTWQLDRSIPSTGSFSEITLFK